MIRLVIIGVTLASTALAGYIAKRKLEKVLGGSPCPMYQPPPYRQTTTKSRRRHHPIQPSDNGDTAFIPLP